MASLFSLLQAPVVYSCVAGVEGGRGLGGRKKGRGGWEEGPFSLLRFSSSPLFEPATEATVVQKAGFAIVWANIKKRPIDSRTRTRFDLKVLCAYSEKKKIGAWKLVFNFNSPAGLSRLFLLKELSLSVLLIAN